MAKLLPISAASVEKAAIALQSGDLVVFPTETVYGLGADSTNAKSVARIFDTKQRPQFNPLISHLASAEGALAHADFSLAQHDNAEEWAKAAAHYFWPGPLTLIVPKAKSSAICDLACAGLDTVALRVPAHKEARALLAAAGCPVAAPSANRSGEVSPTSPAHVSESLKGFEGIILAGGRCDVGLESSVLDVTGPAPVLLRPGAITAEELSQRLGVEVLVDFGAKSEKDQPRSPGQTLRHYAPNTPIRLRAVDVEQGEALLGFGSEKFIGIRGGGRPSDLPKTHHMSLSESGDLNEAAANLFAMLRALDKAGASKIAVMDIPKTGLGIAINERLQRAADACEAV